MNTNLTKLRTGQKAKVRKVSATGAMRRRLQDLGLIEDTEIECVGRSPLGDPAAYLIRGAVVALRDTDAAVIDVTVEPTREEAPVLPAAALRTAGE